MPDTFVVVLTLLAVVRCSLATTDYLPTIFWNEDSPALDRRYWSKVVNVKIFQTISFLCPNKHINLVRYQPSLNSGVYYNLYVREVEPNDTDLNFDTVCDAAQSRYVFSCNVSRTNVDLSPKLMKSFRISTDQPISDLPSFKRGKDYIFFSTSDGNKNTLTTNSTKCTLVFRIHFCNKDEECPISQCATYGREEVCTPKSPTVLGTSSPRDVRVTANATSTLTVSWRPPLITSSNISHYTICYRRNSFEECRNKTIDGHVTTVTLENLNVSTLYRIRVRAHTCKGTGNYSAEVFGRTVKHFISSKPRNVTVMAGAASSIDVSWTIPEFLNGDVMYYSICYRGDNKQDCQTQLAEASQRSRQLLNLDEPAKYLIRVRAHTCVGPGIYSDEVEASVKSPITGKETGEQECKGIQWTSFIIGLVTGFFPTLVCALLVGYFTRRQWKKETKAVTNATNAAYRSSTVMPDNTTLPLPNGKRTNNSVELNLM